MNTNKYLISNNTAFKQTRIDTFFI